MKRFLAILLALTVCCALIVCVHASQEPLVDDADVLTVSEEKALRKELSVISSEHDFDAVIVTTQILNQSDILEYGEDYYEAGGYGEDGIIFVALTGETPYYGYVVFGDGNKIFDDDAMDSLDEVFVSKYKSGDYYNAFLAFANKVEQIVDDHGSVSTTTIVLSILIGALLAWLVPMSMLKGELKSVRTQAAASSYVRRNSMVLTRERDLFLYRNVTRTAKPKNNSSSGGTRTTSGGNRGRSG